MKTELEIQVWKKSLEAEYENKKRQFSDMGINSIESTICLAGYITKIDILRGVLE